MKTSLLLRITLPALLFIVVSTNPIFAQFSFSDNATNYGGSWTNGSNQGTGYNGWGITTGGANSGTFIGNPSSGGMGTTNIGTTAFALFGHSSQYVNATRYFGAGGTNVPMQIGDVFSFYWAMNWDCGSSGSKGFDLRADGTTIFNVNNSNSATISTTNGATASGYGTNPMLVTLTRTSWTQYTFTMTARDGNAANNYSTTINSSSNINNINIYCGAQQDNNGNRNIFFNAFNFTKAAPYATNFDVTDTRVHSGGNGLTKTGANILTLSGTNTYTGSTTITAGTVRLGAANCISNSSNMVLNGGTFSTGAAAGFAETVGTLNLSANSTIALGTGSHNINFSASNGVSWTANTQLTVTGWTGTNNGASSGTAGRIFFGNSTSGLTLLQLSQIVFNISGTLYSAAILSTGEVVPNAVTPLYYGGAAAAWNTSNWSTNNAAPYATAWTDGRHAIFNVATTTLTGASVNFPLLTATQNVTVTTVGGTIGTAGQTTTMTVASGATVDFAAQGFSTSQTFGIVKNGPGTIALAGGTYGGGFTLNEGVAVARGVNAFGGNATPGALTINGGTLAAQGTTFRNFSGKYSSININADFTLGSTVAPATNVTMIFNSPTALGSGVTRTITIGGLGQSGLNSHQWSGVISGTNSNLVIASSLANAYLSLGGANNFGGSFTMNMTGNPSQVDFTVAQAYGGATTITSGLLRTTIANALPAVTALTLGNNSLAVFDLNNFDQTVGSISGGGSSGGNITLGTAVLTSNQSSSTTYTGVISGTGGLTKSGSGTLTLSGANTYTGLTTVSAGTLQLGAANVLATGNITLNGGTLRTGSAAGFSESVGTLNLSANSTIALGTGAHTLTFANSSAVSWAAATTLTITGWSGTAGASGTAGQIFVGVGGLTAGQLAQISFNGFPGTPILLGTGELVPPAGVASYTWNATTGSADWQAAASWTPARNTPATTDVLNFTNGGVSTATNIPTQTIGKMVFSGTSITFHAATASNTLTISGGTSTDFSIDLSSTVTLGNGTNAMNLAFSGVGHVAEIIDGIMTISAGSTLTTTNSTFSVFDPFNYNGGTVVVQGTLAGNITNNGSLQFDIAGSSTYSGVISGTSPFGDVLKINSGTLTFSGANTYTYGTLLQAGTLLCGAANTLPSATNVSLFPGATLNLNNFNQSVTNLFGSSGGAVVLGTATFSVSQSSAATFAGVISGTGGFTKAGSATLTLSGANSYSGATTINAGTLACGATNTLPGSTNITLANTAGVILNLANFNQTVGSIGGGGASGGNITLGTATLTTNTSSSTTYSGVISGTGGLTKSGSGTLTLSGANTYTGLTTVSAGTLQLGAAEVIANSSNVTLSGGALQTGSAAGFNETVGTLNLTANSTIALGTGNHSLTFANSSAVSWTAATTLTITGWTGTGGVSGTAGKIFVGNAAGTLTAGQLAQISFSGYGGTPILLSTGELVPPASSISYTWNGTTSSAWGTTTNWTPNGVPGVADNVTISVPGTNTLSVDASRTITNFTVSGTGTFTTTAAGALTVTGSFTATTSAAVSLNCASTLTISNASAQTIPAWSYGNLNIAGGPRTLASSGTITICGSYTPTAGATTTTGSTVNFNGTTAQSILTNAATFRNLTISNTAADVTAGAALTVSNLLTINANARLDMGTNALTVTGATSSISGFLRSALASTTPITGASTTTLTFNNGGTYECNAAMAGVSLAGLGLPIATWNSGSTCSVIGLTSPTAGTWFGAGANQTFSNFTWNCTGQTTIPNMTGATLTCLGTFTMGSTGSGELRFGTNSSGTLSCGVFNQTGGIIDLSGGSGIGTINCTGNFSQSGVAGSLKETGSASGIVNFNGSASQNITISTAGTITNTINFRLNNAAGALITGILPINSGATLYRTNGAFGGTGSIQYNGSNSRLEYDGSVALTTSTYEWPLSNGPATQIAISGGATISLNFSRSLNNVANYLFFSNGILNIGNFNIAASASNNIGNSGGFGATRMIATSGTGELQFTVSTTVPGTYLYPIGDITGTAEYSPVSLTFSANSIARIVGFRVVDAAHPSVNAPNTPAHYLTRYWAASNSQAGTYTYNGTFTYAGGDVIGTQASIQLNMYDGTNWTQAASTAASNVLTITGTVNQGTLPIGSTAEFTGRVNAALYFQTVASGNWTGTSSTLLTENFNATNGAWTKTNNSTGGTPANAAWTNRPNGYASGGTFTTPDATGFILSDANAQGVGGITNTLLVSPVFSTSGLTSASIELVHHFSPNTGTASIEASTDGSTWGLLTSYSSEIGVENAFATSTIALAPAYLNQPTVYIRFRYNDDYGFWWAINNVVVTGYNAAAVWQTSTDAAFVAPPGTAATVAPNHINSLGITIRNGHTVTVNTNVTADDLTVAAGGTLTVSSPGTFTLNNGTAATDFTINGNYNVNTTSTISSGTGVINNGTWTTATGNQTTTGSTITQSATAVFDHAFDGGTIPTSTWNTGSTLKITGMVGASTIGGMNQSFHHVVYECAGQTITSVNLAGSVTAINGNLTINNTGGTSRELRLFSNNANTNSTLTITGDVIMNAGKLAITNSSSNGAQTPVLTINGNLTLNGSSVFDLTGNSAFTATSSTVNLLGNLTINSTATIVRSQATPSTFRFNKASGTQTFTAAAPTTAVSSGAILWQVGNGTTQPELVLANDFVMNAAATFTVNTAGILNAGTQIVRGTTAGSTGTFILNSGGTLKMGSASGITTPPTASGNIQTNTRTFDAGGIYEYNGSVDQSTGNGLPATIARLIINNSGTVGNNTVTLFNGPSLTLSNPSNSLRLTLGLFSVTSTKTVNMPVNGNIVQTAGDFASGSLGGTVSCPSSSTVNVSGAVNFWSVTTTGGIDFGASPNSSTINGTFTLNSGGFVANTNAPFYATNSNLVYATSYTRFDEWRSTTGRGYPFNVIINASQTFNLQNGAGDNTPRQIAGSLTLNAASIFNMNATTGSLTVLGNVVLGGGGIPNTTLSLSTNIGGDMIVGGNWQNGTGLGGVIFNTNNRSVSFSGGAPQTIGGLNSTTFSYLDINNTTNVTLNINTTVATELRLNSGKLILGANNLSLNAFANIVNASSSRYVVTDGAGQLIQSLGGVNTLYPVGPNTTNFAPAILAQFGTVDNIGVRVKTAPAFDNAVNDVLQMVNYQWYLSEGILGGNSLYTQFQWGGADEATNFIRTNPVFHGDWTGSSYNIRATNSTVGGNPYSSGSSTNYSGNLNRTFVVGNLNGIKGCISSVQNGDWNTSTTWEAGVIPPKDANVCLNHNVTINTVNPDTVGSIVFGAASNLTVSNGYTITMSNGGFLNNAKPGLNLGSGKVVFSGTGAISGTQTITFNDVDINNGLTVNTTPTINGVFRINSGGFLITNTVNYSPTSTLTYNTGGTYGRNLEWSATTGAGYPNNVQLSGNTLLNLGNGGAATARQLAGNLTIDGGSGLTMAGPPNMTATLTVKGNLLLNGSLALSNSAGGDFVLEGNWERNGTTGVFTSNNRAVFFTGLTNQHVRVIGGGTENFAYLLINKPTAGTFVRMFNTIPDLTDLRITGTSGAVLQLLNNGGLDINGRTVGIDYISNTAAPAVWVEVNGAREIINSAGIGNGEFRFYSSTNPNQPNWYTAAVKNVGGIGTLTFEDNVLMTIADGACDFGVSAGNPITFIKGVLQVKLGASVGQTMNSCFYATGSTLRFANTVDYQVPANDKTWASGAISSGLPGIPYNVEILDNGTDLTLNSTRALKNNLTIVNGTFTINLGAGSEFSLGGNWSRSGVSSAFNNNAGARVVFRGTSPQTITSTATGNTETFREFEISNSGGVGNNTLTLAGSTRLLVTDSIIFTQGIITTGTNRVETNASTVYVAGAGNTNYTQSWINGNLRRNINASNTTIEFPVGLATRGNLAVLTNNNLTGITFFDADFHPVAGGNNAELSAWETSIPGNPFHTQYTSMNSGGFWSIEPNAQPTSGTYDLRLYFNGMLGGMVDNQFGILKRNNGSATYADFKPFPGTSINASNGTGRTIAGGFALRMGYTSFSEFGIGLSGVPLPVQLTTFSGYNEGSVNKLNWNTSSELNSMEFQIERSADGINFQQIGTEAAAGFSTQPLNYNFTDVSPLNGVNYYRLKMVDMDHTYTYSNIIAINPIGMTLGNDIILFPNPSTDNVFANITTVDRREINIVVIDISGRLIMTNRVQLSEGNHIIPIGTSALAGGNYIIEFRDQQNNLINSKKFIKKN